MKLPTLDDETGPQLGATGVPNLRRLLEAVPYANLLGVAAEYSGAELVCRMSYSAALEGFGALHGGTVGALLELAAALELIKRHESAVRSRLISFTVSFLRAGRLEDTLARAYITRQGRRVTIVRAEAWQGERSRLIATAQASFFVAEQIASCSQVMAATTRDR